jgi:hypothetical protein
MELYKLYSRLSPYCVSAAVVASLQTSVDFTGAGNR